MGKFMSGAQRAAGDTVNSQKVVIEMFSLLCSALSRLLTKLRNVPASLNHIDGFANT